MKVNWTSLVWIVYVLILIFTIIGVIFLPFKTPGERTGFFISTTIIFFFCYGVFALFAVYLRWRAGKSSTANQVKSIKWIVYYFPFIAFYGAFHVAFFQLPKAIAAHHFMELNGISMVLGLTLGGLNALQTIREIFR